MSAFYDRRDEDGSIHRTMETSQPKRADLPTSKASRPIAPLKPNEMQHSKEFPATQLRAVSNKSPFIRTGFQPKQARQSPDLQHSMVAWRGFEPPISALRGRRPKPLDDQAKNGWGGRSRTLTYGTRNRCPAIRRHPSDLCALAARVGILRTS